MSKNNELYIGGKQITSPEDIAELQDFIEETKDHRMLRCDNGKAEILVTEENVLMSNDSNYVIVNQFGTTVDGKFHMAAEPSKIRINGFWTLNEELLTTLPSTIYTPIPVLVYSESPAVKNIQSLVKFLQKLA